MDTQVQTQERQSRTNTNFPARVPVTFADHVALGTSVLKGIVEPFAPTYTQAQSYRTALQRNGVKGDTNPTLILGWLLCTLGRISQAVESYAGRLAETEQRLEVVQAELDATRKLVVELAKQAKVQVPPALSLTDAAYKRRQNERLSDMAANAADYKEA